MYRKFISPGCIFTAVALLLQGAPCLADVVLQRGELSVQLDPEFGGRISALQVSGHELLYSRAEGGNNSGSTFWLSPQTLWSWPPVAAHDSMPYQLEERTDSAVRLQSAGAAGARVEKTVRLLENNLLQLDYRIRAERSFDEVAAWEITRVAKRGVAFAPVHPQTVKTVRGHMNYALGEDEILWLDMSADTPLQEGKVIANGSEGWLAYATEDLLYLKVYPIVHGEAMASGEGDVELYLSGDKPYLELEVQSAAQSLAEGEALDWHSRWLTLPIPDDIEVAPGSQSLLQFVRTQLRPASQFSANSAATLPRNL